VGSQPVGFDVGDQVEVMNYPVQYSLHQIQVCKRKYRLVFPGQGTRQWKRH
jgi:hypothetical protein